MNELEIQEAKHMLTGIAEMLFHYLTSLLAQGFTRDEAFRLTMQYQMSLTAKSGEADQ